MDGIIYKLKAKYGKVIRVPIPTKLDAKGKMEQSTDFYFRRLSIGEWMDYQSDSTNALLIKSILSKALVHASKDDNLDVVLDRLPALAMSTIDSVSNGSDFSDDEAIMKIYHNALDLSTVNILLVCQMIIEAYPSYKIHEIMDMNSETLMKTAAFAETKLKQPYYTEYILQVDKFKEKYKSEFGLSNEKEDFEYTYELHIKYKHKMLFGDDVAQNENQFYFMDGGKIAKGDPSDYRKKKELFRENVKRKQQNLPPIGMAEFYSKHDGEGVDPTQPNMDPGSANKGQTLQEAASKSASKSLRNVLSNEKELKMQGKTPSKTYDWRKDPAKDVTWD